MVEWAISTLGLVPLIEDGLHPLSVTPELEPTYFSPGLPCGVRLPDTQSPILC